MKPKPLVPSDAAVPWYEEAPVSKETLRAMLSNMCEKAGIQQK